MNDFEKAKQLFMEGLNFIETNDYQAAEIRFTRALELVPNRVSTLNNLATIKIRLGKFKEAEELARKAVAQEDASQEAWSNLGIALAKLNRHEEALQSFDRALEFNSSHGKAWLGKALALFELNKYDEALTACERALKLNSSQYEALYVKSLILKGLKQPEEAKRAYQKSIEIRAASSPTLATDRRATQKAEVLVINQNPAFNPELKSFEALHLEVNFPGQLAWILNEDFHFTFAFKSSITNRSVRDQIAPPDFVINNNANGESLLAEDGLSALVEAIDSFGVPVVNHPDKVVQTTRDASVRCLNAVPGILVPKTERFSLAGKSREKLIREIEEQYDYPLITRTLASQEGQGMTKVDSREALAAVLSSNLPETFFVTAFVDSRNGNPFYRKIRAAIVQDEIIIVRVDYDPNWNVHGRKSDGRVRFYLENASLLALEKQICADPEKMLGTSVVQALQAMRRRIPLDIFGVDFDVEADGRLVFYEANASMNLFSTAREEVRHPVSADESLKLAIRRYFATLHKHR